MRALSTRVPTGIPHLTDDMALLHVGLGVLMAHFIACADPAVRSCLALRISRQLRIIAEHRDVPDWALRPLYRTMAARWQVRAIQGPPCATPPAASHRTPKETLWEDAVETRPPLNVLMAASLYLMTRYAEDQRPETAGALAQHLQWISAHPECARSPLGRAAARLALQWQRRACQITLH